MPRRANLIDLFRKSRESSSFVVLIYTYNFDIFCIIIMKNEKIKSRRLVHFRSPVECLHKRTRKVGKRIMIQQKDLSELTNIFRARPLMLFISNFSPFFFHSKNIQAETVRFTCTSLPRRISTLVFFYICIQL